MVKPVQTTVTAHETTKSKKVSSMWLTNRIGTAIDINETIRTFVYTFFKYSLTERPIMPRNISRRAARQHCDMAIATIKTVSGTAPIRLSLIHI